MNIFVLDADPGKSAEFHCDRHMKMICETAQMMSTCVAQFGIKDAILYKPFNPAHTCNRWLMESRENFKWLLNLGLSLSRQNFDRYKKEHASSHIIKHAAQYINLFPDKSQTPFKLAMFPQYMGADTVNSYKLFYAGAKFRFANWKKLNNIPNWWDSYREYVIVNNLEVENDKNDYVKV